MTLIVFLRGVNVGGHRRFRPSALAKELSDYGVVNIGAAGTFIVRKPGSRTKFHAELRRRLPFETEIIICDKRDFERLEKENLFAGKRGQPDVVRFVSIFGKNCRCQTEIPFSVPEDGDWLVRVLGLQNQFVFGEYRRHMKTIGCLGKLDKLFGASATTRNWNTILTILNTLKN